MNGIRRKWKILAAAALTIGAAAAMTSYGEVYVSDSFYDWNSGADTSGPASPQAGQDRDSQTGPGAQAGAQSGARDQARVTEGPSVTQVTLKEQYHQEYKVYEEAMGDLFFFYTNVSNGGITDKSVILDIPQNMFCTMEKDGVLVDYIPGQPVSGYGTYVAKLTAVEDTSVPFSEQKEYRALFRFRIQEKPAGEAEESQGTGFSGIGHQVDWNQYASQTEESQAGWGLSGAGLLGQQDGNSGETGETETGETEESRETESQETESSQEQESRSRQEESSGEQSADGRDIAGTPVQASGLFRPRTQLYDSMTKQYQVIFENGRTLISNIPEGFTGPGAVEISVSAGEPVTLYCNDSPVEYVPGNSITEPGYYRLDVDGQMWSFVIASALGDMDYYVAPAGMELTGASFNGEEAEILSPRYLLMKEDGRYDITMTGRDGETLETVLTKDTEAPKVQVNVKGGRADIQYLSDDVARIVLTKDGQVQEDFAGYQVSAPGSYELSVTDGAGNVSSRQFTLKYQVNVYGIVAVVLVILLIIGGTVFVIHVKKTVKVR